MQPSGTSGRSNRPEVAPAFNTGGGGFEFENLVGAWAAAGLLAGGASGSGCAAASPWLG
jgi:hypothetical protein